MSSFTGCGTDQQRFSGLDRSTVSGKSKFIDSRIDTMLRQEKAGEWFAEPRPKPRRVVPREMLRVSSVRRHDRTQGCEVVGAREHPVEA